MNTQKNEFDNDQWTSLSGNSLKNVLDGRKLLVETAATVAAGIVSKRSTLAYKDDDTFVAELAHGSVAIAEAIIREVARRTP